MGLECRGCNNESAYRVSVHLDENKNPVDRCDRCGAAGSTWMPDVYWPGHAHTSENVLDKNGEPVLFTSRRHKAEVLREQGLSEAGDRHHGSRSDFLRSISQPKQQNSREVIRAALSKAQEQMKRKYHR